MDSDKNPAIPYLLGGISQGPRYTPGLRERRAQPRRIVDARANLLLVKGGSALRGRILNLSLIGCRIHCDEKFRVGIYTRVETEFRLGGMPFLLAGVIQAIHGPRDLGIRFLDISPRKQEQIQLIMDEIEEFGAASQAPNANPSDPQS
jgi:hypothetical protein